MQKIVLPLMAAMLMFCVTFVPDASAVDPAKSWDRHFNLWLIISVGIWLIVTIPLIYLVIKYKEKRGGEEGADIHGNPFLEVVWTAIPLVIVILLGTQSWALYREYRAVPQGAYEVKIEGFQFGYEMTYPEGIKTTNELRVPEGTPVKVLLTSRDVIHTFSIPKFRVKEDMIPGRTTYMWFQSGKPGEYIAYCSEYCGTAHSMMRGKVIVMKKDDFKAWVAQHKEAVASMSLEARGEKLVKDLGCIGCHSITGEKGVGATFKGLHGSEIILVDGRKVKADDAYIKESIVDPKAKLVKGYAPTMPPYTLSEADLNAIAAYLKTVK